MNGLILKTLFSLGTLLLVLELMRTYHSFDPNVPVFLTLSLLGFITFAASFYWIKKNHLNDKKTLLWTVLVAFLLRMIALPGNPIYEDDMHRYMWDGKVFSHGINPYFYTPDSFALEEIRDRNWEGVNFKDVPTITLGQVWTQFNKVQLADHSTKRVQNVNFNSFRLAIDYGLRDNLDFSVDIPYESSARTTDGGVHYPTEQKFGDGRFRLKYQFMDELDDEFLSMALSAEFKTPLSDYDEYKLTSLGDGQNDFELALYFGHEHDIADIPLSWSGSVGHRWRDDSPADEVIWAAEINFEPVERWWSRLFYNGVKGGSHGVGLESPEFFNANSLAGGRPQFPRVKEEYQLWGISLSYQLDNNLSISAFISRNFEVNNSSWDESQGIFIIKSF